MSLFNPVTDLSTVAILVENCLVDSESLVSRLLACESQQDKKFDGTLLGNAVFLWGGDEDQVRNDLYEELNKIMVEASSVFLNKLNKTHDDYPVKQKHYKILTWATPQYGISQHHDHWQEDGKQVVPAITNLLYLTSDFEGGELYFTDYDITVKPKAGDVVSFFSDVKHEVRAVPSGRRITTQLFLFDK